MQFTSINAVGVRRTFDWKPGCYMGVSVYPRFMFALTPIVRAAFNILSRFPPSYFFTFTMNFLYHISLLMCLCVCVNTSRLRIACQKIRGTLLGCKLF